MASIKARTGAKGNTKYRALVRVKQGSIIHTESKTFDSKRHAESWAKRLEIELEKPGGIIRRKTSNITVGDLVKKYIEDIGAIKPFGRSKSFSLDKLTRSSIAPTMINTLEPKHIIDFCRARRNEGAGGATVLQDVSYLKGVFSVANATWGIPVNLSVMDEAWPVLKRLKLISRAKKRTRRPTFSELLKLIKAFKQREKHHSNIIPMVDIFLFSIASAMRQSEICGIKWCDLDYEKKTVIVRKRKDPENKDENDQVVPLLGKAWRIILKQPKIDERIFPFNARSVSSAMTRTVKKQGIENLRFHDMRHEGASRLFEKDYMIQEVAIVTGHKDWNSLKRYTHIKPESLHREN